MAKSIGTGVSVRIIVVTPAVVVRTMVPVMVIPGVMIPGVVPAVVMVVPGAVMPTEMVVGGMIPGIVVPAIVVPGIVIPAIVVPTVIIPGPVTCPGVIGILKFNNKSLNRSGNGFCGCSGKGGFTFRKQIVKFLGTDSGGGLDCLPCLR